jgi:hypothetical protein
LSVRTYQTINNCDTFNYEADKITGMKQRQPKKRLRFRPRSFWPFLTWTLATFIVFRVLISPLMEGVYNYVTKSQEICELKIRHGNIQKQLAQLKLSRDQMKTTEYVEEQGHRIGLIKPDEEPMLVIDSSKDQPGVIKISKKTVEIGD